MNAITVNGQSDRPTESAVDRLSTALDYLKAEFNELVDAAAGGSAHEVLDEVADVLFRARELAQLFGITTEMLSTYCEHKGRIRSYLVRNKSLELYIARGIINEAQQLKGGANDH